MMCWTHSSTMQTHFVTVQGHGFEPWILCPLCISFTPERIFSKLWLNVHLSGKMCRTHNSALRSQLKVTSLSLEFGLGFVSPLALEGFSLNMGQMLTSVRWCAEPITQLCWLKVKVTIEGHQFEPWILRPLHCHSEWLVKFGLNVRLSEMMCRNYYNSTMNSQGQGYNWRSFVSSCSLHISWTFWKIFMKLVKCLP